MKGFRQRVVCTTPSLLDAVPTPVCTLTITPASHSSNRTLQLTNFQHEQLSRAKDSNKSSKKKDSNSGTASPLSASTTTAAGDSRSPNSSNAATPSSSSTNVNDIRSKNNAGDAGPGNLAGPHHAGNTTGPGSIAQHFMQQAPGLGSGGTGTPGRQGTHIAPSVIISPSNNPHMPAPGATETMPGDLAPPRPGRNRSCLTDYRPRPKTCQKASGRPRDSTRLGSTCRISAHVSSRSCRGFTKCRPIEGRSCSCRRLTSATSSSTSTTRPPT